MTTTVDQLANAAKSMIEAKSIMEKAEDDWKSLKEAHRLLQEETIPNMMLELGVKRFDLTDGKSITVKQEVYASLSGDHKPKALAWLEDHGFGGLIDTKVITPFDRFDRQKAFELATDLQDQGFETSFDEGVHHSRLKAFLKEQLRDGKDVPMDLFKAHTVMKATVK